MQVGRRSTVWWRNWRSWPHVWHMFFLCRMTVEALRRSCVFWVINLVNPKSNLSLPKFLHFSREFQQFVCEKEDSSQSWSLGWIFLEAIEVLDLWDPRLHSGFETFLCPFFNLAITGPGRWSGETQECKLMNCLLDTLPYSKCNSHPSRCRVIHQLHERRINLFLKPWIFNILDLWDPRLHCTLQWVWISLLLVFQPSYNRRGQMKWW